MKSVPISMILTLFSSPIEMTCARFIGWTALKELVNLAPSNKEYPNRDRVLFCALFSTGGRVSEVLSLKAENFSIVEDEKLMLVRNMRLKEILIYSTRAVGTKKRRFFSDFEGDII